MAKNANALRTKLSVPGFKAEASLYRTKAQYRSGGTAANSWSDGLIQPTAVLGGRLHCISNCLATGGGDWSDCACFCGFWPACGDLPPPGGLGHVAGI
jgi:hypothetical protein